MIPWVRGKFAERRSRWLATRKQSTTTAAAAASPPPSPTAAQSSAAATASSDRNNYGDRIPPTSSSSSSPSPLCRRHISFGRTSTPTPPVSPHHHHHQHHAPPLAHLLSSASSDASQNAVTAAASALCTTPAAIPDGLLRINVYGTRGQRAHLALPPDLIGHRLKIECMYLFGELGGNPAQYRLLVVGGGDLGDSQTLCEASLRDNDELYLLCTAATPPNLTASSLTPNIRQPSTSHCPHTSTAAAAAAADHIIVITPTSSTTTNTARLLATHLLRTCERAPSQADIDHATSGLAGGPLSGDAAAARRHLPIVNIEELVLQSDVQYDIRQILISLSVDAAHIIGMGPHARPLIEMFQLKLATAQLQRHRAGAGVAVDGQQQQQPPSEGIVLQQLSDMGFEPDETMTAMRCTDGTFEATLRWLIEHHAKAKTTATDADDDEAGRQRDQVAALLTVIRVYCHKDLPPPDDMVRLIRDMGFAEPDVIEALKITKNNYAAACDWLLAGSAAAGASSSSSVSGSGARRKVSGGGAHGGGTSGAVDGLPMDSPILRALLSSPTVQASLSKPKMFIAYLSILEDYTTMSVWLSDCETAGTIGHILRTYHEEKHILAINQFVTNA